MGTEILLKFITNSGSFNEMRQEIKETISNYLVVSPEVNADHRVILVSKQQSNILKVISITKRNIYSYWLINLQVFVGQLINSIKQS